MDHFFLLCNLSTVKIFIANKFIANIKLSLQDNVAHVAQEESKNV